MPAVRYRVPYEIAVHANDVGSGKNLTNVYYIRSGFASVGTPAYGSAIAGSDEATMLASFITLYNAQILTILNANYRTRDFTIRAILGKQYRTPFTPILGLIPGAPITILTSTPHGLVSGDAVLVSGVTSPPGANGVFRIHVLTPTQFTLDGSNDALPYFGDGQWQKATGAFVFTYADKIVAVSVNPGTVVGDALPLFATASVRRNNIGVGKSFRSRLSLSPMSESDSVDGGITAGRQTAINAAFAAFNVGYNMGSADPVNAFQIAVSKKLASTLPVTFPSDQPWTAGGVTFAVQRNLGSMTRRKPKLTSVII